MSEFADTDPLGAWLAGDWPPRSEARCWLNSGCTRGYHGVMDEDGCQYGALAASGAPAGVEVAPPGPLTMRRALRSADWKLC